MSGQAAVEVVARAACAQAVEVAVPEKADGQHLVVSD
jgi:hypothetical protein